MRKKIKWRSIRTKIFIIPICFIAIGGIVLGLTNYLYAEKAKLNKKLITLNEFEIQISKAVYYQNLVILKEFNRTEFYRAKNTFYGVSYLNSYNKAVILINKFKSKAIKTNSALKENYDKTINELNKIDYYFKKVTYLQKLRGFKNEGMEGRMSNYALSIEKNLLNETQKVHYLKMRQHEKEFFFKNDSLDLEKLQLEFAQLKLKLEPTSLKLIKIVHAYKTTFDSICKVDNLTGIRSGNGYCNAINFYTSQLNNSVKNLNKEYKKYQKLALSKIDYLRIFAIIIFILVAFIVSFLISSSIISRVRKLSEFIDKFVQYKFRIRSRFEPDISNDEISDLVKNFKILEEEISVKFKKYKAKIYSATEEINSYKAETVKQNSLISTTNEELAKRLNVLNHQYTYIHDCLKTSIELQKTFLPELEKMELITGNFYLKFEPFNLVSSNFYWVEKNKNGIYIAVGDCAGSGALGALMTVNGINLLNQALFDLRLVQPGEILNYLSEKLFQQFSNNEKQIKHTISISLIRIDDSQIHFSGAQQNIILMRNLDLIELDGNRWPLGWCIENELHQFCTVSLKLQKEDRIVMYSNGIIENVGGRIETKFKNSNFLELIKKAKDFNSEKFYALMSDSFEAIKNNDQSTEDVTLLVIGCESFFTRIKEITSKTKELQD